MTAITLHSFFRSSTSVRVRVALGLKGLDYDYVAWTLREGAQGSPQYRAINPQGLVPSIEIDGTLLTQSLPIMEYLDERFPNPPLLPADREARAHVRAIAAMIGCDIHPLNNLRVLKHIKAEFGADAAAQARWFRHWVHASFQPLEQIIASDPRTGDFCCGDSPGLADICLFAQVLNNQRFDIGLQDFPTIARIHAACETLSAFQNASPSRQPDAS